MRRARVAATICWATLWLVGCLDRNPLYVGDGGLPDEGQPLRGDALAASEGSAPSDAASSDIVPPPDAQGCGLGVVSFELAVEPGGRADGYCHDSCDTWLSILTEDGEQVTRPSMLDCSPSCSDCQPQPCAGAGFSCELSPIPRDGLQLRWDGQYVVPGICGVGVHCAELRCALPGRYVAVMCAGRNMAHPKLGTCLPSSPAVCVEVAFSLPATNAVVRGVLPQAE